MANNNVSSLLNISFPEPKRSNFNLGRVNRFSADVGWVIPCYVEEILPNSYKRLDVESLIQTNATVAPLMGSFKVKIDAFFVPLRLYHRHLSLNNINPDFSDDFDYHYFPMPTYYTSGAMTTSFISDGESIINYIPSTTSNRSMWFNYNNFWHEYDSSGKDPVSIPQSLEVSPSSLLDYLGMFPVGYHSREWNGQKNIMATPFIGYFDIWRNFYSNPHDPYVPFRVSNGLNIDRNPTLSELSYSDDVYIPLSVFDSFINQISANSLSSSDGQPQSVDIVRLFYETFNYRSNYTGTIPSTLRNFLHVPLFSAETIGYLNSDNTSLNLYDTRNGMHFGLLRCTYHDDYFNSRFRNDFVSYMEEQSTVIVENNKFTISQLRTQNRIAKYVDKSIFSDTRFGSWIKAHFGVKTNHKLDIPQFLGSISSNIIFNDIHSLAQTGNGDITSNQALGSRASLGQGYISNKGSFVEFKATEPGYLMCMFRIIPYVSYFQGIKKMYLKTSFSDMYKPEFDAIGYDDLQKLELCSHLIPNNNYDPDNIGVQFTNDDINTFNISVGKHPAWLEYMTSYDECHGLMTQKYNYGFWVLNRPFVPSAYDEVVKGLGANFLDFNASTYITPEYFNNIFAVNKYTDNFQVQIRFYDKTKQPISKQILPHL